MLIYENMILFKSLGLRIGHLLGTNGIFLRKGVWSAAFCCGVSVGILSSFDFGFPVAFSLVCLLRLIFIIFFKNY